MVFKLRTVIYQPFKVTAASRVHFCRSTSCLRTDTVVDYILGVCQLTCIYNQLPSSPRTCDHHVQSSLPASSVSQWGRWQGRLQMEGTTGSWNLSIGCKNGAEIIRRWAFLSLTEGSALVVRSALVGILLNVHFTQLSRFHSQLW